MMEIWKGLPRKTQWKTLWGIGYNPVGKTVRFHSLLKGITGKTVLDVGPGAIRQKRGLFVKETMPAQFIPREPEDRKIIRLDMGAPETKLVGQNILQVEVDIESDEAEAEMAEHIPKFLNQTKDWRVDSILLSDVLNYVDYKKVIESLSKHLNPGGRIIIENQSGKGLKNLFSKDKMTNPDIARNFLMARGFRIEHFTNVTSKFKEFGTIEKSVKPKECVHIVARKV